jgi:hypothetical protein
MKYWGVSNVYVAYSRYKGINTHIQILTYTFPARRTAAIFHTGGENAKRIKESINFIKTTV